MARPSIIPPIKIRTPGLGEAGRDVYAKGGKSFISIYFDATYRGAGDPTSLLNDNFNNTIATDIFKKVLASERFTYKTASIGQLLFDNLIYELNAGAIDALHSKEVLKSATSLGGSIGRNVPFLLMPNALNIPMFGAKPNEGIVSFGSLAQSDELSQVAGQVFQAMAFSSPMQGDPVPDIVGMIEAKLKTTKDMSYITGGKSYIHIPRSFTQKGGEAKLELIGRLVGVLRIMEKFYALLLANTEQDTDVLFSDYTRYKFIYLWLHYNLNTELLLEILQVEIGNVGKGEKEHGTPTGSPLVRDIGSRKFSYGAWGKSQEEKLHGVKKPATIVNYYNNPLFSVQSEIKFKDIPYKTEGSIDYVSMTFSLDIKLSPYVKDEEIPSESSGFASLDRLYLGHKNLLTDNQFMTEFINTLQKIVLYEGSVVSWKDKDGKPHHRFIVKT